MWRRFYHATLASNVLSIIENGLDPNKSTGKKPVVWLVDSKRVHWAIAHVALRHNCPVGYVWLASVHIDPRELLRFRWPGVYISPRQIDIYDIFESAVILNSGPTRFVGEGK